MATIVTCAIFATATGIVGAVVTLMGLLAFPAMLKAGYNVKVAAGAITAGGCLGILIPPSVLLIVYGAVAGVSVVQLYAGAFLPGIMLAALYVGYIILLAKVKPHLMPPLSREERRVDLPSWVQAQARKGNNALTGLFRVVSGQHQRGCPEADGIPATGRHAVAGVVHRRAMGLMYRAGTAPAVEVNTAGLIQAGGLVAAPEQEREGTTGLIGAANPMQRKRGYRNPRRKPRKKARRPRRVREGPDRIAWRGEGREKKSAEALAETQARLRCLSGCGSRSASASPFRLPLSRS